MNIHQHWLYGHILLFYIYIYIYIIFKQEKAKSAFNSKALLTVFYSAQRTLKVYFILEEKEQKN